MIGSLAMKIAIIDDDKSLIQDLEYQLNRSLNEIQLNASIDSFSSAEQFLFEHPRHYPYSCIFLDIQMGTISGMDLAKKIRETDQNMIIVFLTSSEDYVFDGYEVNAFRYILKPISSEQINKILLTIYNTPARKEIILKVNGEFIKLFLDEIFYVEAQEHYLDIHTIDKYYCIKENISDFMKKLDSTFTQPHRSYIVNISKINRITKNSVLLENKFELPISRSKQREINSLFIEFNMRNKL